MFDDIPTAMTRVGFNPPARRGGDAVQPYWYVALGIGGLGLLWVFYKYWRIILGIVIFAIIAIALKIGFALLSNWLS